MKKSMEVRTEKRLGGSPASHEETPLAHPPLSVGAFEPRRTFLGSVDFADTIDFPIAPQHKVLNGIKIEK